MSTPARLSDSCARKITLQSRSGLYGAFEDVLLAFVPGSLRPLFNGAAVQSLREMLLPTSSHSNRLI